MSEQLIQDTDFHFPGQTAVYHGKVRDVYDFGEKLVFVTTDRYSAFDRNLAVVPHKGELLTAISLWWFEQTKSIVNNHVLSSPDPNVMVGKKYKVVPIEMIVRGYITGVTNTSLWHTYNEGQRNYGLFTLPEGLKKNDKLPEPVFTPTTKFEEHDRNITPEQALGEGLIDVGVWQQLQDTAMKLFTFGQTQAAKAGLILVDTKYEFGLDADGQVVLIDELHTPDSSRFWRADTYQEKINKGEEPDNYDKEYLRLWFKDRFDPYKDKTAPTPSADVISELTKRYIYVYEALTGNKFAPRDDTDPIARIEANVLASLEKSA